MASITLGRLKNSFKNHSVILSIVRNHWNKDYKPGPYPKTSEERREAAKRYGILAEEYQPMPDDGIGNGDYPALPTISTECKDPYYPYDCPEHKRNFNEPIHFDADIIGENRLNVSYRPRYPYPILLLQFVMAVSSFSFLYWFSDNKIMFIGQIPKQYPYQGKDHYTFELLE